MFLFRTRAFRYFGGRFSHAITPNQDVLSRKAHLWELSTISLQMYCHLRGLLSTVPGPFKAVKGKSDKSLLWSNCPDFKAVFFCCCFFNQRTRLASRRRRSAVILIQEMYAELCKWGTLMFGLREWEGGNTHTHTHTHKHTHAHAHARTHARTHAHTGGVGAGTDAESQRQRETDKQTQRNRYTVMSCFGSFLDFETDLYCDVTNNFVLVLNLAPVITLN